MSYTKFAWIAGFSLLLATPVQADPLLVDSFETGDMSATNEDGFDWGRNNRTSVVTDDQVVYNNGELSIEKPSGRDWQAKDGEHSLRIRYASGRNMSEQRFTLGGAYPEIWYKFWLRVPDNYSHSTSSPSNNKFFATWMDGYSMHGDGPTVFWNMLSNGNGGSNIAVSHSDGGYTIAGGQQQSTHFIRVPEDRGRWMEVVIHVKASNSAELGAVGLWRRWNGEANFTKLHELSGVQLKIPSAGPEGWAHGYIMGWANAPYQQDTEWLLDKFTISEQPLLDSSTTVGTKPNPPTLYLE